MERTKFMQVVFVVEFTLKNLSLTETAIGKQAGWSWDEFKLPPALEQQLMSVPFAVLLFENTLNYWLNELQDNFIFLTEGKLSRWLKIVIDYLAELHKC